MRKLLMFSFTLIAPVLLLTLAGCKRGVQSAAPKPPPGIDYGIDVPTSRLGVNLDNVPHIIALNLYVVPDQEDPKVVADIDDRKNVELHLTEMIGGKKTHPLHEALQKFRHDHADDCQMIINAPADMKYAQIQLIIMACAEAGITRPNFATKGSTESKMGMHFLPCVLPINYDESPSPSHKKHPAVPQEQLKVFISSPTDSESVVRFANEPEFRNDLDASGRTLAAALEERKKSIEEKGGRIDNFTLLLSPKLSTRYDHVIAVYEAAMLAKWPNIGFQSAVD